MFKRACLSILALSVLLFAMPNTGICDGVARTFDYYAELFDDGQTVWVQLQYFRKFGDRYKIVAYSPDKITIQQGRYEVLIPSRYYQKNYYLEIIFDAGFVTPKIDLFPLSSYIPKTAYILLGALFIAFVSRLRFNRWTPKNEGKYSFQPRSFTTWPRFVRSAMLYLLTIESFYFVIIYSPGTIIFIDKHLGGGHIDYEIFKEMGQYSVLWSIFLLTGVLPNFPWVCKWEADLREMLQGYAFIPSEAKAVISQLNINFTAFKPEDGVIQRILLKLGANTFSREDFHKVSDSIAHKWCKLSYLKYRLADWMTFPRINNFFALSKNDYDRFLAEYDHIKSEIMEYFSYIRRHGNNMNENDEVDKLNGLLNATMTKLNDDLEACLKKAYSFISIGILGTEKLPGGRKKAFRFFGLEPFIPERSKIDWDTNIKTIGALSLAVFLPTLLYYIMSQYGFIKSTINYFPENSQQALYWALVGIVMHALTIIVVLFFDRWRARVLTSIYDEEKQGKASMPNKLSNDMVAAMIGFLVGFAIMGALVAAKYRANPDLAIKLLDRSPDNALWSLLPAVTGFFIQYYLNTFRTQRKKAWQLCLQQGLFMSVMGAAISYLAIDQKISDIIYFMLYASFTSFWIGASIGYIFPHSYLKKMKGFNFSEDRRKHARADVIEPATVYIDGSGYACNIVNISHEGAKIDRVFPFPRGFQAQINAAGLGKLNSIIVRKVKTGTIVKFPYLTESSQYQIASYLEKVAA